MLGSATPSRWLLIVDQSRPWRSRIQDCLTLTAEWQSWLAHWRASGESFSLLARATRDQGGAHLFRWHEGQVEQLASPGGVASPVSSTLLVCTHGSRDACCGTLGVRLAQLLSQASPGPPASVDLGGATHPAGVLGLVSPVGDNGGLPPDPPAIWEVSHLGGHRFAPTLWHLPSWRVYGRLPLDSVELQNWEHPRFLRGNAAYTPRLQVLEAHLQQRRSQWPLWLEEHPGGYRVRWESTPDELWTASLIRHSHRGPLSCRDIPEDRYEDYFSYEVVDSECIGTLQCRA